MSITSTLFAQVAAFLILIWLVNRFLWEPLTKALDERRQKVAEGLAAGEQGRKDLEESQARIRLMEEEARNQAANVIVQAEKRATGIVEEAKVAAREEAERIKHAAQSEIEQQVLQAREGLRREVGGIVIAGSERVLGREVDAGVHAGALRELESRL
ncbi:MAG: F0F1 ATP synthase subunit B [Gammaproteobacteria bacterium]|nr:F0F1 ATP synthase subunit B [Gammaproteobacteria bacterium]MDD9807134.1 F0F1 ATP synthase subunit B [Gammaproteobacteria bacterium]MDD9886556.1 F0F1 ATP synthase subunit B [Gammaproteobacteria bacterium]